MKQLKVMLLLLIAILHSNLAYCVTPLDPINKEIKAHPAAELLLSFPVNVVDNNINLIVKVPKGFKKISCDDCDSLEFIPVNDTDPFAWSEIITLTPLIDKESTAEIIVRKFKENFLLKAQEVKVLDETYQKTKNYDEAQVILVYSNQTRRELLKIYAAAGPYDAVIVQDAILIKSDDELEQGVLKLNSFFKDNVAIKEEPGVKVNKPVAKKS